MRKVVLAEKPSVAQSIARIVGATHKKDGFYEGNGWQVTYAFGHLIQLAMPENYGYKRSFSSLYTWAWSCAIRLSKA